MRQPPGENPQETFEERERRLQHAVVPSQEYLEGLLLAWLWENYFGMGRVQVERLAESLHKGLIALASQQSMEA